MKREREKYTVLYRVILHPFIYIYIYIYINNVLLLLFYHSLESELDSDVGCPVGPDAEVL